MLALVLLVLIAGPARAHSGNYDMKYVDGSNVILLTFNTHEPVSGLSISHNIRLYDLQGTPIPYAEVRAEVRRTDGGDEPALRDRSLLVHEETQPMSADNDSVMTFAYPQQGRYALQVTFSDGAREISSGRFAIPVGPGAGAGLPGGLMLPLAVTAFLLGMACHHLLWRRRTRASGAASVDARPVDAPLVTTAPRGA